MIFINNNYNNNNNNNDNNDDNNKTTGHAPHHELTTKNKQGIKKVFTEVNVKRSVGPDGECSNLLKVCAPKHCQVFSTLFTWSLKDSTVPGVWKTATMCHIPQNNVPTNLSDHR